MVLRRSTEAGLAARLERGETLLGVLVEDLHHLPGSSTGLDLLVVPSHLVEAAVRNAGLPVLALVSSSAQVGPARAAGAADVVSRTPIDGVRTLLGMGGPDRLVTSVAEARRAYASGASLVIYDLAAVRVSTYAGLATGRPDPLGTVRPPLVLLSGMLGTAGLWDGLAERIGDLVLPWPTRIDLDDSIAEMADSVLAAAPATFLLGGHSLGGIVALEALRRAPDRVRGLLLISSSGRAPTPSQLREWSTSLARVDAGEFDQIAHELARATVAPARRSNDALIAENEAMAHAVGAEGVRRQLIAQGTRVQELDVLDTLDLPVLVVAGTVDEVCLPALQLELSTRARRGRMVSLEGCGHTAPLEDPVALSAAVRAWLRDDVGVGR